MVAGRRVGDARLPFFQLDRQPQEQKAPGFAVGIQVQGLVDPAFERLLQDEVERAQVVDAVAPDRVCGRARV